MAGRPLPSRTFPRPQQYKSGPYTGMTDAASPAASRPDRCRSILNAYRQVGRSAIRIVGRPGFTKFGSTLDSGPVQWVGQFSKKDGTTQTVAICKGQIYVGTWGGNFALTITTSNLTAASITLDGTAICGCITAFDTLIISDGVHTPFSWDGTSGGGLTSLSNAPIAYGQPAVYYSKLFFIKAAERDVIVWSEEGTPNTGYEAGGYNNAWSLPGIKGEWITALAARNDSLGVIRPRSVTTILGAVNDAFQTTGTRSSVTERTGSSSAGGTIVLDEGTVFLNSDGLPEYWPVGGGVAQSPSMSDDCQATLAAIPRSSLAKAQWVYDPETNLILLGIGNLTAATIEQIFCFERTGGVPNFVGRWTGMTCNVMGMALDTANVPRLLRGTDDGIVYYHGVPNGVQWNDDGIGITHEVQGPALGYDEDNETRFDEVTVVGFSPTGMSDCVVSYETTHGVPTTPATVSFAYGGFLLDFSHLDVDTLTEVAAEQRVRVGINGFGRWLRPIFGHSTLDEQFGIELMAVTGSTTGRFPEAA